MPGTKRRADEDMWLTLQLKKSKFVQVNQNVYESTLAKLRQGARNVFASQSQTQMNSVVEQQLNEEKVTTTVDTSDSDDGSDNEKMELDIVMDSVESDHKTDVSFCEDCRRNRLNQSQSQALSSRTLTHTQHQMEQCRFCEKTVCHLNYCKNCSNGFCGSCCIAKYDEPSVDTFICISCLCNSR